VLVIPGIFVSPNGRPATFVPWMVCLSSSAAHASDSFPAGALDDHVRIGGAYFDVIDTEYKLLNVGSGTELRVRMRYRVSTAFNWYTRPFAEFLVGDFEEAALRFYARRAETS
jgi:hypothetical protein